MCSRMMKNDDDTGFSLLFNLFFTLFSWSFVGDLSDQNIVLYYTVSPCLPPSDDACIFICLSYVM